MAAERIFFHVEWEAESRKRLESDCINGWQTLERMMVWELFWVRWIEMKRWKLSCHVNASLFSFLECLCIEREIFPSTSAPTPPHAKAMDKSHFTRKSKNINKVDPFRLLPRWAESKVWDFSGLKRGRFFCWNFILKPWDLQLIYLKFLLNKILKIF